MNRRWLIAALALVLGFCGLLLVLNLASRPHPAGGRRGSGLSAADLASAQANCPVPYPPSTKGSETPHGAVSIQPATRWQPYFGDAEFKLSGMEKPPQNVKVFFAWDDADAMAGQYCFPSTRVKLLPKAQADPDDTYTYTARVPSLYKGPFIEAINGWDHRTWKSTVPLASIYVHFDLDSTSNHFVITDTLGISSVGAAIFISAIAAGMGWYFLDRWARYRKVPGGFLLRFISTPNGVASLSQFQIYIWTFVIGTGVIYVMMITGNLIDIPVATLGLLGISGFSLVGSKLQAGADGSPQRTTAPGAVTDLNAVGAATVDTIVLTWNQPAAAQPPYTCTIRKRLHGGAVWQVAAQGIAGPPYAVSGLLAGQSYDFEVFGVNDGGPGVSSLLTDKITAQGTGAPANPPALPKPVQNLKPTARNEGGVHLQWSALSPPPQGYKVQYRRDGTMPWVLAGCVAENCMDIVDGLAPNTLYQFEVSALSAQNAPGPASDIKAGRTKPRAPQWSDLVVSENDDGREVDLARLQMLVFTSIAALFTGLTLINTGQIPDIPVGELALVGVSNGVYLASKAAGK